MSRRKRSEFGRGFLEREDEEERGGGASAAFALMGLGALAVGAIAMGVKSLMSEPPVAEPPNTSSGGEGRMGRARQTSSGVTLREWVAGTREELRMSPEPTTVQEGMECKLCYAREIEVTLDCGHVMCRKCAVQWLSNTGECPYDRERIESAPRRIYL